MTLALELTIRLLGAALLGALIGYERELRAKGAGIRTHVLVMLGSTLFMIISQYGFAGADKFDAARIAAGVVGGLGFLGGGIIMKTKNHVSGLTTAAGLWVTGAVGLAMGAGMYELSILCTILLLISMEALNFYSVQFGQQEVTAVLSSADGKALTSALESLGKAVKRVSFAKQADCYQAEVNLVFPKRTHRLELLHQLASFPDVELINME